MQFIAGPCVMASPTKESPDLHIEHALRHAKIVRDIAPNALFKISFRKANRSSWASYQGPSFPIAGDVFTALSRNNVPWIADVHTVEDVDWLSSFDPSALQIPAFLCKQLDLQQAVAETELPVYVKKGQWIKTLDEVRHIVDNLQHWGARDITIIDRGPFDLKFFQTLVRSTSLDAQIAFDCTHSVDRHDLAREFGLAAVALGARILFAEVHDHGPERLLSDGQRMMYPQEFKRLVDHSQRMLTAFNDVQVIR